MKEIVAYRELEVCRSHICIGFSTIESSRFSYTTVFLPIIAFENQKRFTPRDGVSRDLYHQCCLSFVPSTAMSLDPDCFSPFEVITLAVQKLICYRGLVHVSYVTQTVSSTTVLWNLVWERLEVSSIELEPVHNLWAKVFGHLLRLFSHTSSTDSGTSLAILEPAI